MAYTVNFTYSQAYGNITLATLIDTSTGTDPGITGRLVYLRKADGTYLVPMNTTTSYIFWPVVSGTGDTININILDQDYALDVTVIWYTGSTEYNRVTTLCLFRAYAERFLRQLTFAQAGRPKLLDNDNYWTAKCKLRTLVDDAVQGVALINDQTIAQYALEAAKEMIDNPSLFY